MELVVLQAAKIKHVKIIAMAMVKQKGLFSSITVMIKFNSAKIVQKFLTINQAFFLSLPL
jgi:hypothetical protein